MLLASVLSPWGMTQLAAVALGAVVLLWRDGVSWMRCFVVGIIASAIMALLLGPLVRLPGSLARGALPSIEVMSFGALAGLVMGFVWQARRSGRDIRVALDCVAVPAGVMVAVARVGCFFAGCDFGSMSDVPWAVSFGEGSPAHLQHLARDLVDPHSVSSNPVHPTQLYEAALGIAMIGLAALVRRPDEPGRAFVAATLVYAFGRALIEVFRADDGRGFVGPLSMPQLLAFSVVALLAAWWLRSDVRGAVNPKSHNGDHAVAFSDSSG